MYFYAFFGCIKAILTLTVNTTPVNIINSFQI